MAVDLYGMTFTTANFTGVRRKFKSTERAKLVERIDLVLGEITGSLRPGQVAYPLQFYHKYVVGHPVSDSSAENKDIFVEGVSRRIVSSIGFVSCSGESFQLIYVPTDIDKTIVDTFSVPIEKEHPFYFWGFMTDSYALADGIKALAMFDPNTRLRSSEGPIKRVLNLPYALLGKIVTSDDF